jgi:hypothetical protein
MSLPKGEAFCEKGGKLSIIRILATIVCVTGCVIALTGAAGMLLSKPESVATVTAGSAMAGAALAAKAWQKKSEDRQAGQKEDR